MKPKEAFILSGAVAIGIPLFLVLSLVVAIGWMYLISAEAIYLNVIGWLSLAWAVLFCMFAD